MTDSDQIDSVARDLWDTSPDVTEYPPGTIVVRRFPDGGSEVVVYPQGATFGDGTPTETEQ